MKKINEKSTLYYSILKYIPDSKSKLNVNIGLAVHYPLEKFSHLYVTSNPDKIAICDTEFTHPFFDMIMKALQYNLNCNSKTKTEKRFKLINDVNYLTQKTNYLTKEIIFTPVQSLEIIHDMYYDTVNQLIKFTTF